MQGEAQSQNTDLKGESILISMNSLGQVGLQPQILVCQNRTCRKAGATRVLQAFQQLTPEDISVVGCGCLGHCGSGPMALVLPEEVWYDHVQPEAIVDILQRH